MTTPAESCSHKYPRILYAVSPKLNKALAYDESQHLHDILTNIGNHQILKSLHDQCLSSFPHAGKAYAAIHTWRQLFWQPVYLAIISVHALDVIIDTATLRQSVKQGSVYGYQVGTSSNPIKSQDTLNGNIMYTATRLRKLIDSLFNELSSITKVPRRTAYGLVADCTLSGLMLLPQVMVSCSQRQIKTWAITWLDALGLSGTSDLMTITTKHNASRLMLDRKTCCLHYLNDPENLCVTCPRQDQKTRFERIIARENLII
ncbi:siderophore ferric iron reductase [Thalassotalea fusca]